jgi:anti-sigma factor RsiW
VRDVDRDFAQLQNYIVGRLSADQRRALEDRLVGEPRLVAELELYLRMRDGLQQLKTQGLFAKDPPRRHHSWLWSPALAAAAGAGLVLFLWTHRSVAPPAVLTATLGSHTATAISPVAARFTFVAVRGSAAPDLDLPAAGLIELRAAPATRVAASHYRVSLVRRVPEGSQPLGALAGLVPGSDGYVHTYADASRLAPGSYVLRIEPDSRSPGMAESFPFTLRAPVSGPSP